VAPFDNLKPVRKFTNRKAAVVRIWQAVTRLSRDVAEPAQVAPRKAKSKKSPARAKKAATARKGKDDRGNNKAEVVAMMRRAKGVTLAEIMEHTGWQVHTVRGFVSIQGSKGGLKIESSNRATAYTVSRSSNPPFRIPFPTRLSVASSPWAGFSALGSDPPLYGRPPRIRQPK
jgi:hypothetical protein